MSFHHMQILKTNDDQQPSQVEAWTKRIRIRDTNQNGMSIGDYSLDFRIYDCTNKTVKYKSSFSYHKEGSLMNAFEVSAHDLSSLNIAENSIAEAEYKTACAYLSTANAS